MKTNIFAIPPKLMVVIFVMHFLDNFLKINFKAHEVQIMFGITKGVNIVEKQKKDNEGDR